MYTCVCCSSGLMVVLKGLRSLDKVLVSVAAYVPCPKDLISASLHFWDILAASAKMYTQGDAEVTAILFHDK